MNEKTRQKLSRVKWYILRKIRKITWLFSSGPFSRTFGFEYGTPVDRFYIEDFLKQNCTLIRGDVLEIAENTYTLKFGSSVVKSHVLHVTSDNADATIVGNLETGENIPENAFDCIILTQTLPFIFDKDKVLFHCYRALRKGGYLLVTVPMLCPLSLYDAERWGDFWRFTPNGLTRLLEKHFPGGKVQSFVYGNYYAAQKFLAGIPVSELSKRKLRKKDIQYSVLICAAAEKI